MASLTPLTTTTVGTGTTISGITETKNPLFPKTSQLSIPKCRTHRLMPKISCKVAKDDDLNPKATHEETNANKLDRRNMLLGLGGLCGAATTLVGAPATFATPIATPDPARCGPARLPSNAQGDRNCCPPGTTNVIDFTPSTPSTTRVRPPAHMVDSQYLQKFTRAMTLMKALPDSDPRSFSQQAKVHCAYCSEGYRQVGFPTRVLQVHNSWLFLPFHRFYLYFFEKILGSLINDPTFAIPFWNWDHPSGMRMPTIYTDGNSPLYDPRRDRAHQPPTVVDLNYDRVDDSIPDDQMISANLTVMYRQMVSNARTSTLFLGQPYRAGDSFPRGGGSLENVPHGPVHVWTCDRNQPNLEDMGNFYSAGRDPIFYAHHANIDRMWSVWKTLGSNRETDFTDTDWLNASFIFYDENAQAVRVRVRDCLDTRRLGYTYQNVDLPWLNAAPTARRSRAATPSSSSKDDKATTSPSTSSTVTFPRSLESVIRTNVKRPNKSSSKKDKEAAEEVLVVELELLHDEYVKFDVYINDEDDIPSKDMQVKTEYAGSFVNVPHKPKDSEHSMKMNTSLRLGLSELIEVLGADDDETVVVSLVPRSGKEAVVIKNIKIEFASN